jgi:hypothetical protein
MQARDPQLTFQMHTIMDVLDVHDLVCATIEPLLPPGSNAAPAADGAAAAQSDTFSPADLPFMLQAEVLGGCIIVPQAAESRRTIVGTAHTLTVGLPGRAIEGIDTGVTASADIGAAQRTTLPACVPHVSELLPMSAGILKRHHAATQVRCSARCHSCLTALCHLLVWTLLKNRILTVRRHS